MKWLHYAMLIMSWLTAPFIGKKTFLRFLPAATFISLLLFFESELAKKYKWWKVKSNLVNGTPTLFGLVLGPFLIGSIWIFKFTNGRFKLYIILNAIVDGIFSYLLSPLFEKLKVYKLQKFTETTVFINFMVYAILMYGYQMMVEKGHQSDQ